jgi:hypothetical protein
VRRLALAQGLTGWVRNEASSTTTRTSPR